MLKYQLTIYIFTHIGAQKFIQNVYVQFLPEILKYFFSVMFELECSQL